jgi:hypothetical protein
MKQSAMNQELFTIKALSTQTKFHRGQLRSPNRGWTRDTKVAAIRLADMLAKDYGIEAVVTLTSTGWEEYRATVA